MTCCGKSWQPTALERVVELLATSTRPVKVETDEGFGVVKLMGNRSGDESLAFELVGSELAVAAGLHVPPFAVLEISGLLITMADGKQAKAGPAFISKWIKGAPADPDGSNLRNLTNPEHLALLLTFDTWIRNGDRCPPSTAMDPTPRYDNLFVSYEGKRPQIVALDHSHAFAEGQLEDALRSGEFVSDIEVYGNFPIFSQHLRDQDIESAVLAVQAIPASAIRAIVDSVPAPWGVTQRVKELWADQLIERAGLIGNVVRRHFIRQGRFLV